MIASKFVYAPRHARWTNTAPDMAFVRVDHIVHTATLRSDIRGKHGPAPVSAWPIARESGQFPASWSDCHFTTRVSVIVQSPAFRPERVYPPKPSVVAQPNRYAALADNIRYRVLWIQHNLTDWQRNRKDPADYCPAELGLCDCHFNSICVSKSLTQCILTRMHKWLCVK